MVSNNLGQATQRQRPDSLLRSCSIAIVLATSPFSPLAKRWCDLDLGLHHPRVKVTGFPALRV